MIVSAFATVAALALVHVFVHRMEVLDTVPRSRWLSLAGGASVAYVFLHLLPELVARQAVLGEAAGDMDAREEAVWIVALTGLATFYGLERMVRTLPSDHAVYRLHLASFALYNLLVGYLVVASERESITEFVLFALAMGLHYLAVDFGLLRDHPGRFEQWGRWLLSVCLFAGAGIAIVSAVPEWSVAVLSAFLGGGVLLNVLKEELPEERRSRFGPFLLGVAGYGTLLLAI